MKMVKKLDVIDYERDILNSSFCTFEDKVFHIKTDFMPEVFSLDVNTGLSSYFFSI